MSLPTWLRRGLLATAAGIGTLLLLAIALVAAVDGGLLRQPFTQLLGAAAGRHIEINGALHAQLLSLHPQFVAEDMDVSNPSWMPPGLTAQIRHVVLVFATPGPGHWLSIERLSLDGAQLMFIRDEAGAANWQAHAPHEHHSGELPLLRYLSLHDARASLDDARRHLRYEGSVSIGQAAPDGDVDSLQIIGSGELNGAAVNFKVTSDALASASRSLPYHFRFEEHSNQATLTGQGELEHAFTFSQLSTSFSSAGHNLKDLYQLAGVTLINTGPYSASGHLARQDRTTDFSDLVVSSGQSDMGGSVSIYTSHGRSTLTAHLKSDLLRTMDLGARAIRRDTDPLPGPARLFSEVALKPEAVRRLDAAVDYHAREVLVGHLPLQRVSAMLHIDQGILSVAPLNAAVLEGSLSASLRTDAVSDSPTSDFELQLKRARIGLLHRHAEDSPPFDAPLDAEVKLSGNGTSAHQFAATANGSVNGVFGPGLIRSSLAELSAGDLRGLGMLLAMNSKESALHCGVMSFQAHDGTLSAQRIALDTDQVMITGEGQIDLNTEEPHLTLNGHPKSTRLLRVSSPVSVGGTLLRPKIALTGVRSMKLIDHGQPAALDCAALPRP